MLFCSLVFIFIFLPTLLFCYHVIGRNNLKIKNIILLIFSLFFYAYGGVSFLPVMLASIFINYLGGITIEYAKTDKLKKCCLVITVLLNLAMLGYFKYTTFFVNNISNLLNINIDIEKIALPIGISFFTFQGLSYVVDVYRKKVAVQKNPLIVALYISLFPQLIAGPIVTYDVVEKELIDRKVKLDDVYYGITRFFIGLGKKMILANTMGQIATNIFSKNPESMVSTLAALGAITYGLQIYFDFSGYSDMAIGLGRMFGFKFLENFNYPYVSNSITDFWRRWHISLSTWFRDYVYIPLGGNRVSKAKHIRNLFIVWTITGFWHGASWNFIVWGLYFGVLLIIEKYFLLKVLEKTPKFVQHCYALFFILVGWIIFNSQTLENVNSYLISMLTMKNGFINDEVINLLNIHFVEILVAMICSMPISKVLKKYISKIKNNKVRELIETYGFTVCSYMIFAISLMKLIDNSFNPFIYFRF